MKAKDTTEGNFTGTKEEENFLSCVSELKDNEDFVKSLLTIKTYKKGTILIKQGEIPKYIYSVLKGCVRQYKLVDGEEKTTMFYTEDQSIFMVNQDKGKIPSNYYLQCTETSTLTLLTKENESLLFEKMPYLEPLNRNELLEQINTYHDLLSSYITLNPEERYNKLLEDNPSLVNRVPQYQLAGYLGIKPESLSRIRNRITKSK